ALLGDDEARERAARLLRRVAQAERGEHELDVISGNAGAIAGLIVLRDLLDDAALVEWAARLGDELVRVAERSAAGWSWRSADFPRQRPLTGFAHGAAGVAYALLELYHATGGAVYRAAAEAAFAYERGWFDVAAGNWPDFRERPGGKSGKQMPHAFAASWCHGAPGIALSRLRAYALLGDDRYRAEALTALRTTYGNVESALASGRDSFSLCHGLAGNAEVLLAGERVLGSECPGGAVLALEVARAGMGAFGKPGLRWDHGGGVGETPGLLLGLAGIGYSYLRLRDPTTPSILLIERDGFGGRGGGEDGTAEGAEDAEEGEDTERGHGVRT
ncbi:MAG TPA: lanthionine synthetase LanC family protein, partial [Ktedonobacterales bacterium]